MTHRMRTLRATALAMVTDAQLLEEIAKRGLMEPADLAAAYAIANGRPDRHRPFALN